MPEGDTVWRAARAQHLALAGHVLTRSDFRVPAFATLDLAGETVHEVVARGKHLLHRVGELSIHSHLKMEGTWRLFSPGQKWTRPAFEARVVLDVEGVSSVGFALGILEVVPTAEEDTVVGHLGPDLLGPDWDAPRAVERLSEHPDIPVFVALLNQRNLAGLGNVYANEICFLRGLDPHRLIAEVDNVPAVVDLAKRLIVANRDRAKRVTTGNTRDGQRFWVYGRGGQPCRRCGTRILHGELGATELTERLVWWCPNCQR